MYYLVLSGHQLKDFFNGAVVRIISRIDLHSGSVDLIIEDKDIIIHPLLHSYKI